VAPRQVVIGDHRAEMVDVMEPDIAREKPQYPGQFEKRTAFKGHLFIVPYITAHPVGGIELVLYIEQVEPEDTGNGNDEELDQEDCFQSISRLSEPNRTNNPALVMYTLSCPLAVMPFLVKRFPMINT
jgi:hypothetical protein